MPITDEQFEKGILPKHTNNLPEAVHTFAYRTIRGCKVCRHPKRAEYEERYFNRQITQMEIASEVGCSDSQVSEHMRTHVMHEIQQHISSKYTEELAEQVVDVMGTLRKHILRLDEKLDNWYDHAVDPQSITALKAVSSELRNWLKDLAMLKGQLKETPIIKLQQIKIEFKHLQQLVIRELCPNCKQKVLEVLEADGIKQENPE